MPIRRTASAYLAPIGDDVRWIAPHGGFTKNEPCTNFTSTGVLPPTEPSQAEGEEKAKFSEDGVTNTRFIDCGNGGAAPFVSNHTFGGTANDAWGATIDWVEDLLTGE